MTKSFISLCRRLRWFQEITHNDVCVIINICRFWR